MEAANENKKDICPGGSALSQICRERGCKAEVKFLCENQRCVCWKEHKQCLAVVSFSNICGAYERKGGLDDIGRTGIQSAMAKIKMASSECIKYLENILDSDLVLLSPAEVEVYRALKEGHILTLNKRRVEEGLNMLPSASPISVNITNFEDLVSKRCEDLKRTVQTSMSATDDGEGVSEGELIELVEEMAKGLKYANEGQGRDNKIDFSSLKSKEKLSIVTGIDMKTVKADWLKLLPLCPKLKFWGMDDCDIDDEMLKKIALAAKDLKQLTQFSVDNNKITAEGVRHIGENLRYLQRLWVCDNDLGIEGMKVLSPKMGSLIEISVDDCKIGPEGLRHVVLNMKKLKKLHVFRNNLGDDGAELIGTHLPELIVLGAGKNEFTDRGGVEIAKLTEVEELCLEWNYALSDVTMEAFALNFKKIKKLSISGSKMTMAGLRIVVDHLKVLERMFISKALGEESVQLIKSKIPNCEVIQQ